MAKKKIEPRKIAIVGFTEHRRSAPWMEDTWTIWGMNNLHTVIGEEWTDRAGAWFNLHPRADSEKDQVHTEWAKEYCKVPYYTFDEWQGYPTNVRFPASDLTVKYGTKYFTNTVSWMVAFAMATLESALVEWKEGRGKADADGAVEEWDERMRPTIGIWGVDMAATSEYAAQRPSCEYFIGIAKGLGYEVVIADGSELLKSASMYGMSDDSDMREKMKFRMDEHQNRINEMTNKKNAMVAELQQIDGMLNQFTGAIAELQYFHGIWTQPAVGSTRSTGGDDGEDTDAG